MRFKLLSNQTGKLSPALQLSLSFAFLFLIGVLAGILTAAFLNLPSKQALYSDINGFINGSHTQTSFFESLWQVSSMPLLVFCLSFTCFGVLLIPVAVVLQGYLLSFSVSAMIRLLSWRGCLLGAASFGIRALTIIPCLLILSVQCFLLSKQFLRLMFPSATGSVKFPRGYVFALICSLILLPLGAAFDTAWTETAVSVVLNHFIF